MFHFSAMTGAMDVSSFRGNFTNDPRVYCCALGKDCCNNICHYFDILLDYFSG